MSVIFLVLVSAVTAIVIYERSRNHSFEIHGKEAALRQGLSTMRKAIDLYTEDKQKAPQSLDDLVSAGYIKKGLPVDPFTNSSSTWQAEQSDDLRSIDQKKAGIVDVHSGSSLTSSDGSAYSSW